MAITRIKTRRGRFFMKRPPRNLNDMVYTVDLHHVIAGRARWRILPVMVLDIAVDCEGVVRYHVKGVNEDFERTTAYIFRTPSLAVSYALAKVKAENGGAE